LRYWPGVTPTDSRNNTLIPRDRHGGHHVVDGDAVARALSDKFHGRCYFGVANRQYVARLPRYDAQRIDKYAWLRRLVAAHHFIQQHRSFEADAACVVFNAR
jgi:hypothetical protein